MEKMMGNIEGDRQGIGRELEDNNSWMDSDEVGVTFTPIQAVPAIVIFPFQCAPCLLAARSNPQQQQHPSWYVCYNELRQGQEYLTLFFHEGVREHPYRTTNPEQKGSCNHELPYQHSLSLFGTRQSEKERTSTLRDCLSVYKPLNGPVARNLIATGTLREDVSAAAS